MIKNHINNIYTRHARVRCQQRGVSSSLIDIVLEYGCIEFHQGYEIYFLNKQKFKIICKSLKKSKKNSNQIIDKLKKIYVVVQNGVIITIALKYRHFKRTRK